MSAFDEIVALLGTSIGLNVESIGVTSVERATKRRIGMVGLRDEVEYAARVRSSPSELLALIEEIVVPETWFFRDERPFRYLAETVVPRFRAENPKGLFRVLSVPCATGEEPYSIAMTLLDAGLPSANFHVEGIDISERAIGAARRAMYGGNAFRGALSLAAQARHFTRASDEHKLDPSVANLVSFARGNLLDATFLPTQRQYDVVFCRNLLIYLDKESRRTAAKRIDKLLAPQGTVFLGHAESLDLIDSKFKTESPSAFAFRREPKRRSTRPPPMSARRKRTPLPGLPPLPLPLPSPTATGPHLPFSAPPPEVLPLERATELANAGLLEDAKRICEDRLQKIGPDAAAYSLLGVIHHARGEWRAAEELFSRAVYLDKDHYESLIYLALLCDKRDDAARAAQFRKRAERVRDPSKRGAR